MKSTERSARKPSLSSGLLAVYRGLPRSQVSGVASGRPIRAALASLAIALGLLTVAATPALAVKLFVPVGNFGAPGAGNGDLERPTGIAVNDSTEPLTDPAAGDVYVADPSGNHRVEQFTAEGAYVSQIDEVSEASRIAVDNSNNPLDPAAGDLYVAEPGEHGTILQFSPTGTEVAQLTGTCAAPGTCPGKTIGFGRLSGLAVDPSGNLWVYSETSNETRSIDEFSDTGSFIKSFGTKPEFSYGGERSAIAVDSSGDVFVLAVNNVVLEYDGATGQEVAAFGTGQASALAIDPSTNDLLVDNGGGSVAVYGPAGQPYSTPLETFSLGEQPERPASEGIAMSSAGTVYIAQASESRVEFFSDAVPYPRTEQASGASETVATLHGTLSPNGEALSECSFEYGTETSYGQSIPCAQTPAQIGKGTAFVAIDAELTGLQPRATYHFRLHASNTHGGIAGADATFYTVAPPLAESEAATGVLSNGATLSAQVDASGLPTSYRFEYGTSEAYGSSTAESNLGAPTGAVAVNVNLTGLQSHTLYHARLVATNALGSVLGSDFTFVTGTVALSSSATLPDNRAYELVSSPLSNADVYPPNQEVHEASNETNKLARAAAGGNAVVYQADPGNPTEGGSGNTGGLNGNIYMATRGAGGWAQSNLQIFNSVEYEAFSSELSVGVMQPESGSVTEYPRIPSAVPAEPANCKNHPLFSFTSADGGYHSLVSSTPSPAPIFCSGQFGSGNEGTATVPQYSHILYESESALTPETVESTTRFTYNIYDSVDNRLYLVSVLPNGQPATDARVAGTEPIGKEAHYPTEDIFFNGASSEGAPEDISADGTRVFWGTFEPVTSEQFSPKALYVRENDTKPQSPIVDGQCSIPGDACTVQIDAKQPGAEGESGGGVFWAASSDGSKVFFTDESRLTVGSTAASGEPDLYEYQAATEAGRPGTLTDLTLDAHSGEHANVLGLMGVSDSGAYVYFGADGVLTTGKNAEGHEPQAGQTNLYMLHEGVVTFIATADPGNEEALGFAGHEVGDLTLDVGLRTAEATADGHNVVFRSRTELTGYENDGLPEVFVYDAETGRISCASCDPMGMAPSQGVTPYSNGASLTVSHSSDFMLRWISEDGARVFFVTAQPLVQQDVNGLLDVYEWERPNSGSEANNSCTTSSPSFSEVNGGCVYLLSGGTSSDDSYFLDASASGNDVFIRSRLLLAPQSVNENMALYDARVEGGFPATHLACTGTGCQGVPPTGPIFATPSSTTFNGVGNFAPGAKPTPAVVKKKCTKGKALVRGKCVKRKAKKSKKVSHKRSKRKKGRS